MIGAFSANYFCLKYLKAIFMCCPWCFKHRQREVEQETSRIEKLGYADAAELQINVGNFCPHTDNRVA